MARFALQGIGLGSESILDDLSVDQNDRPAVFSRPMFSPIALTHEWEAASSPYLIRGSRASRRPSPRKVNESIRRAMAPAGNITRWGKAKIAL